MGHPGSRNDKTIVKSDEFLQAIKIKSILYNDVTFQLYDNEGIVYKDQSLLQNVSVHLSLISTGVLHTVRGAYLISDNGYAKWRMLQAPIKSSSHLDEMMWSTRLESVRKDPTTTPRSQLLSINL